MLVVGLLIYLLIGILYSLIGTILKTMLGYKITKKGMMALCHTALEWPNDLYYIIKVIKLLINGEIETEDIDNVLKEYWYKD